MSADAWKTPQRLAWILAAYGLLEWLFAYVAAGEGLVTPRAALDPPLLALGAAYLVARLAVHTLVPGVVAYALASAIARRLAARWASARR